MNKFETTHIDDIKYKGELQRIIVLNSLEEEGIWDVITEVAQILSASRLEAFELIKSEIDFIGAASRIFLIYSEKLYDTATCKVLDKKELLNLTLEDVEFKEEGPFYYFSSVPEI
jgi:hypothetical protein